MQPGGRVTIRGETLKALITVAWDITPDMLAGKPKWLDQDRFDIVANAPTDEAAAGRPPDFDSTSPDVPGASAGALQAGNTL